MPLSRESRQSSRQSTKPIKCDSAHRKLMSESRCISNLKVLGSDKAEFKSWNEKLINAAPQSLGLLWRKYMRNPNKALDQNRKVLDDHQLNNIEGAEDMVDRDRAAEDIYYVLVERTEGEAAFRVNSTETGEGTEAYQKIYSWFAGTTGLALSERTRMLMHPERTSNCTQNAHALTYTLRTSSLRANRRNERRTSLTRSKCGASRNGFSL